MLFLDFDMDKEIDALDLIEWYRYLNALYIDEVENDLGRWKM